MLLGFKRRFAPFVEDGSKSHTIRAQRARTPRVGEMCHCYVDPRQKTMRLLGRWPCVKVERIEIAAPQGWDRQKHAWKDVPDEVVVTVDGVQLSGDEREALAFRDGFRSSKYESHFAEMMEFWKGRLPFSGHIIHWRWSPQVEDQARKPKHRAVHG